MTEQAQYSNEVRFCLTQLKDFVACWSGDEQQPVNWEEIHQRKDVAKRSLEHLESIFDSGVESDFDDLCGRIIYPRY